MDHDIVDVSMRHARRIDVWLDSDGVEADRHLRTVQPFQTVVAWRCTSTVWATAELTTGRLEAVHAEPRVLLFAECPLAVLNIPQLVGTPLQSTHDTVLDRLKGVNGCTQLNDALTSLAEAPVLARLLPK
jgi:hypothetical protein